MRYSRENEFWTPEPIWKGETVFLLGGGPSLTGVDLCALRGRQTMTINSSLHLARDAGLDNGVLFFMDNGWWHAHRDAVLAWPGSVMTLSRAAKRDAPNAVRRIQMSYPSDGFPAPPAIRWGRSSGHVAIALAVAMGAQRIVLLGYDMQVVAGRSHHHADYNRVGHPDVYEEFRRHFEGWNAAAKAIGVEIVNATPGSALIEFPAVDLSDIVGPEVVPFAEMTVF